MHMLLGVLFAMLLESGIIGKVAWRTILLIPWAVPGYISVIMWRGMVEADVIVVRGCALKDSIATSLVLYSLPLVPTLFLIIIAVYLAFLMSCH